MNIPNLQAQIERRAKEKINQEINILSDRLRYTEKPAIIEGVQIKIPSGEGDQTISPYLCQIYDCKVVRDAIIEHNLDGYIQKEIDALLNKG